MEYYQDGNYKKAVEVFQRLKEEYPLSTLAIMAEMGIADSYFSAKEYAEAELAYTEFINLHPTNENLSYAMYQIGMCHFNQIYDDRPRPVGGVQGPQGIRAPDGAVSRAANSPSWPRR